MYNKTKLYAHNYLLNIDLFINKKKKYWSTVIKTKKWNFVTYNSQHNMQPTMTSIEHSNTISIYLPMKMSHNSWTENHNIISIADNIGLSQTAKDWIGWPAVCGWTNPMPHLYEQFCHHSLAVMTCDVQIVSWFGMFGKELRTMKHF